MAIPEPSFDLYLHDLHDLPLLTPEKEQRLSAEIEAGNGATGELAKTSSVPWEERQLLERRIAEAEAAREALVAAHLRLVVRIARQYTSRGISLLDLIQEGNLALVQAARNFEPGKGGRFATYAAWWIRHAIARAVASASHPIRVPDDTRLKLYRLHRARVELLQQLEREPHTEELADATGLTSDEIGRLAVFLQPVLSLETRLGEDADDELLDMIADPVAELELSAALQSAIGLEFDALLQRLTDEESAVLTLRFGLRDQVLRSRQEVASELSIPTERVQRLEARALRKLRDPELLRRLRAEMDD